MTDPDLSKHPNPVIKFRLLLDVVLFPFRAFKGRIARKKAWKEIDDKIAREIAEYRRLEKEYDR